MSLFSTYAIRSDSVFAGARDAVALATISIWLSFSILGARTLIRLAYPHRLPVNTNVVEFFLCLGGALRSAKHDGRFATAASTRSVGEQHLLNISNRLAEEVLNTVEC